MSARQKSKNLLDEVMPGDKAHRRRHPTQRRGRRPQARRPPSRRRRLHDPQALQTARWKSVDHRPRHGAISPARTRAHRSLCVGKVEILEDQITAGIEPRCPRRQRARSRPTKSSSFRPIRRTRPSRCSRRSPIPRPWPISSPPIFKPTSPKNSASSKNSTSKPASA